MEPQKNVAFAMMLDYSGSMRPVMPIVIIDAKAFVRYCFTGDEFVINKFSDFAYWLYPSDGTIATVTEGGGEIAAACAAIDTLRADDCTNITEAIDLAQQAIAKATRSRKALVLLSDGYANVGGDPDLKYDGLTPLYIASIGENVWRSMFEKLKAKNPENEIYWQPTAVEMMQMFNSIRSDVTRSALLVNNESPYCGSDYQLEKVLVSRDEPFAQFSVVWDQAKCRYTTGVPHGYEFNVYLVGPDGKRLPDTPDVVSEGCCIFNKTGVKAGEWSILVQYSVDGTEPIHGTVAGFLFSPKLELRIDVPNLSGVGKSLTPVLTVWDGERKVEDVEAKVRIVSPTAQSEALCRAAAAEASNEKCLRDVSAAEMRLRDDRFREALSTRSCLVNARGGEMGLSIDDTRIAGPYNLECEVTGIDPRTGREFRMVRSKTVLVG